MLEKQHFADREMISGIMNSKTFKVGLALSKLRDRLTQDRANRS